MEAPAPDTSSPDALPAALGRLLAGRYSCRAFDPRPVPRAVVEDALAMAQRTPSWCNTQPWQVHVASGESRRRITETLHGLAASDAPAAPDFPWPAAYQGVYRDRRRACGLQLYDSLGILRDDRDRAREQGLENYRGFGAPHVAFLTTEADLGVYGALDCGLYLMSLMLALQARGVATIAQAALAAYPDAVRHHFGLVPARRVVCGLSFGYGLPEAPVNGYRTAREDFRQAVQWSD